MARVHVDEHTKLLLQVLWKCEKDLREKKEAVEDARLGYAILSERMWILKTASDALTDLCDG